MEIIDISNEVTDKFYDDFKKGQALGFLQPDESIKHYKIVRLDKRRKIVKVQEVKLYTEQEANDFIKNNN